PSEKSAPRTSHSFEPVNEPKDNTQPLAVTAKSRYAFEGEVIRLNQKDFTEWQNLYSNIDLEHELRRLDIEFRADKPKNWFITASQKLNYQNKNTKPAWTPSKRVMPPSRTQEFIPENF
ncbi:hypothetical protein ABN057_20710, partial [Providencia alcalifaciens]